MAVVKDTYVLEAQAPNFKGLDVVFDRYLKQLDNLQAALKNALADPKAANLTQKQLEGIVQQLSKIEGIQKQLGASRGSILSGNASVDLSKTAAAVAGVSREIRGVQDALIAAGKASKFLDAPITAARGSTGRGLKLAAASNAGSIEALGRTQLDEAQNARALGSLRGPSVDAASIQKAQRVANLLNLKALAGDAKTYEDVLRRMAEAAANGTTRLVGLGRAAKQYLAETKAAEAATESATAGLRRKEAVEEAAARATEFFANKERERIRALIETRNELRNTAKASVDASNSIGAFSNRFDKLGGEGAKKALQELTEVFAKNKLTATQQVALTDQLITKYEKEAAAARNLTAAINEENIVKARANVLAARRIAAEVATGGATAKQGAGAIEAVQKRIDTGELKTSLEINKAVTAELQRQIILEKAQTSENKVQTQITLQQKTAEAKLTEELTKHARVLGYTKSLHGDMRSVMAQTVAEAHKLGLTYAGNKAEVLALLQANVALKKLQSEAGPKQLNQFGVAFAAGFAAQQIEQGLASVINRFAEFEDELIKVRRTADASRATMSALGQEILGIGQKVPVAAKELAAAAAVLGQTGAIAFDPNVDYDKTSAEIRDAAKAIELVSQVSLVAELNIEQAATSYGQFAVVFSKDITRITETLKNMGVEGVTTADALRVLFGSINEVGNKTVATTEDLLTFIRQFGGTAASFGIAAEKVAALGGAVRDAGAHADVAGTAFVRFFSRATQDAEEFGKVIGISGDAFRARFSTDALGTIVEVFKELGKQSKTNKLAVTDFLRSLKVESREQGVFTKIIENYTLLEKRLEFGQDVAKNYNSVQGEAAKRSETWSASVTKLSNAFQALVQTLEPAVAVFSKLVSLLADVVKYIASTGWISFVTAGGVIAAGISFAVLQTVKLVVQFQLAAQAIRDMSTQMREFTAEMLRARNIPPPGVPGGTVGGTTAPPAKSSGAGKIAGVAAAAAAIAGVGLLATGLTNDYGEKGQEAGEALTKGVADGIKTGASEVKVENDKTSKEVTQSWLSTIASVGLAVAALAQPLLKAGGWILGLGTKLVSFAGSIALVISRTLMFKGAITAAFSTALAGVTATVVTFTAALSAAAVAGWLLGRALDKGVKAFAAWLREAPSELEAVKEEIDRLTFAGESWERINSKIGAKSAEIAAPFKAGAESIAKSNAKSQTLLNTWKDLAKTLNEATEPTGTVAALMEKLSKTGNLTEAKALFDAIQKATDSDMKEFGRGAESATTAFRKMAKDVTAITGKKIDTDFIFSKEEIEKAGAEARKALAEEGDNLRLQHATNVEMLNTVRDRVNKTGDPQDTAALKRLEEQNVALVGKLKAIGDVTASITKDAVADYVAAIEAQKQGRAAGKAVEESARSNLEALRSNLLRDFDKTLVGLGKTINELEEKAETGADAVVKDYAGKRADFVNRLNAAVERAASLDVGGKLRDAANRFSKAWDDAFAAAWGKASRNAVKEKFSELRSIVDSYADEINLRRKGEDIAAAAAELRAEEEIQVVERRIDALKTYTEAIEKGAAAFKGFDEISARALTQTAQRLRGTEDDMEGLTDKFLTTAEQFRKAWEDAGGDVRDTLDQIKKSAEDASKALKQSAFDAGREAGGEAIDRRERNKDATRTLRQSSTARDLITNIQGVRRRGGDEVEQGRQIGAFVRQAELKFDEQGIDAGPFLDKLKQELGDLFKGGTEEDNAAKAVREVGKTTNEYLSQIAKVFGAKDTSQQGAAVASGLSPSGRPSDRRSFLAQARKSRDDISKEEAEIKKITDTREVARRTQAVQRKKEDTNKASMEFAIDEAFKKLGLDKKQGEFGQDDFLKANKEVSALLNKPEFKDVKQRLRESLGVDKRAQFDKGQVIDFESLRDARARAVGESKKNIESPEIAKAANNASGAAKAQAEAQNSLYGSLTVLMETLGNAKYTERIKALEATVNKATNSVGGKPQ